MPPKSLLCNSVLRTSDFSSSSAEYFLLLWNIYLLYLTLVQEKLVISADHLFHTPYISQWNWSSSADYVLPILYISLGKLPPYPELGLSATGQELSTDLLVSGQQAVHVQA